MTGHVLAVALLVAAPSILPTYGDFPDYLNFATAAVLDRDQALADRALEMAETRTSSVAFDRRVLAAQRALDAGHWGAAKDMLDQIEMDWFRHREGDEAP